MARGAEMPAPTTPARETRALAFTRVRSGGRSRGTAAARVTPYALEATRQPKRRGEQPPRPGDDGRGEHPAQEAADRHRGTDRPAAAVAEAVEEGADQRRHDREREHRQAEEQRHLAARLARGHLEEEGAGQRDRDGGVARGVEGVQLDQPGQPGVAGALGAGRAPGLPDGEVPRGAGATPRQASPAAGRPGTRPAARAPRAAPASERRTAPGCGGAGAPTAARGRVGAVGGHGHHLGLPARHGDDAVRVRSPTGQGRPPFAMMRW